MPLSPGPACADDSDSPKSIGSKDRNTRRRLTARPPAPAAGRAGAAAASRTPRRRTSRRSGLSSYTLIATGSTAEPSASPRSRTRPLLGPASSASRAGPRRARRAASPSPRGRGRRSPPPRRRRAAPARRPGSRRRCPRPGSAAAHVGPGQPVHDRAEVEPAGGHDPGASSSVWYQTGLAATASRRPRPIVDAALIRRPNLHGCRAPVTASACSPWATCTRPTTWADTRSRGRARWTSSAGRPLGSRAHHRLPRARARAGGGHRHPPGAALVSARTRLPAHEPAPGDRPGAPQRSGVQSSAKFRPDVLCWWAMGGMSLSLISGAGRGLPAVGVVGDDWMENGPQVDARSRNPAPAAAALLARPGPGLPRGCSTAGARATTPSPWGARPRRPRGRAPRSLTRS